MVPCVAFHGSLYHCIPQFMLLMGISRSVSERWVSEDLGPEKEDCRLVACARNFINDATSEAERRQMQPNIMIFESI